MKITHNKIAHNKAEKALETLLEGNKYYQNQGISFEKLSCEKRSELNIEQTPLAVILSCSDSRVPLEIIFNQPHGNLFVVRVAGNTFDNIGLGSIEFGIINLNIKLILVLGHSNCGAIKATLENYKNACEHLPDEEKTHIKYIIDAIKPALKDTIVAHDTKFQLTQEIIEQAAIDNAQYVARKLFKSSAIIQRYANSVKIVPANYNIITGKVTII